MFLTVLIVLSATLQTTAAVLALRMIPITRHRRAWIVIALAMCLLAARRVASASHLMDGDPSQMPDPHAETFAVIGSLLLVIGMAAMKPLFQGLRNSEDLVRQSERRYRNLYESAPCGFLSIDLEGIIRQCNRQAEQILGYTRGKLLGIPMAGLLLQSNKDFGRPAVSTDHLWDGVPLADLELQMCTADARAVWVSLSIHPMMDPNDAVTEFRAVIVDISERVAATERLRLTQYAVDHVGEAVTLVNSDGQFVYANDVAIASFGFTREESLTKHVWDVDSHFSEAGWATFWNDVRSHETVVLESEARHSDGAMYPVEVTVSYVSLSGHEFLFSFIRDISERKRVQRELQLTQFAVDHAGEAIHWVDKDARLIYVNDAACAALGYSRDELLSMTIHDVDAKLRRDEWPLQWTQTSDGQTHVFDSQHRRKDGTVYPIEVSLTTLTLDGQMINCAFIRDISERLKAAAALRESEELHRTVVEALDEGVMLWGPAGKVLAANPSAERLLNVSVQQAMASDNPVEGWEFFHPDGTAFSDDEIPSQLSLLKGQSSTDVVIGMQRMGGDLRWFSANSRPVYHAGRTEPYAAVVSFRDITSHKAIEDALRESDRRFSEMLAGVQLIALTLDLNGNITFCNDHLLKATGWKREEVIGRNWFDQFIPADVRAELNPQFRRETPQGTIPTRHENDIMRRDGERRLIRWSNTILRDPQGIVIGTASIGEDITERKQTEEALQRDLLFKTAILDISELALSPTATVAAVAGLVLDRALALTGSRHGFVAEVDPASGDLICHTLTQMLRSECQVSSEKQTVVFPKGPNGYPGLWGYALNSGQAFYTNVPGEHPATSNHCPEGHVPITQFLSAPALSGKEIVGQIALANAPSDYTDSHLNIIRELAAVYAMAVERRRTEGALRKRESQLEEAQRLAHVGSWELDVVSNTLSWSDEVYRIFGIDPGRFGASYEHFIAAIHPDDRAMVDTAYAESLAGKTPYDIVLRVLLPDGSVKYVQERCRTEYDEGGRPLRSIGTVQDITERKKAEEEYRLLFESNPLPMMLCDLDDLTFMAVNEAAIQMYGYSRDEFAALKMTDIRRPEDVPFMLKRMSQQHQGFEHVGVIRHLKKDGSPICVDLTSYRMIWQDRRATLVLAIDITERRQAEEQIVILKHILDAHHDGVYWINSDNNFVYVNAAGCKMLGFEPQELLGKSISSVNQEASPEGMKRMWDKLRTDGFLLAEGTHRRRDGTEYPVEIMTTYLLYGDQEYAAGFARDISDRTRAEEQILRAKRLEAAGQLAGQIAHDFNNLLGPLIAYPEMISAHLDGNPRIAEMLHDMEDAARQIADINQELLTMSRRGHYNLEPLELNRLIEHSLRTLTTPAKVTVSRELGQHLALVRGGSSQIMRLLANLLNNAVDAMPDGGSLTVRTSSVHLDQPLKRYIEVKPGEFVRLDITDTGRGIPDDIAERIFEPFFTTKKTDRKRGSGLGLAVVHSVIEDHEGYVDFESTPGVGTTFSLYFPVSTVPVQESVSVTEILKGNGQRVLVVDDDSMQRRIAERALTRLGYEVHSVASGEEAVAYVTEHPQDILLLDMVMDGIDGTETLRRIKRTYPDQIAIILSGYACSDRVDEALRLGAKSFIQKPVQHAKLAAALHDALSGKQVPAATPAI